MKHKQHFIVDSIKKIFEEAIDIQSAFNQSLESSAESTDTNKKSVGMTMYGNEPRICPDDLRRELFKFFYAQ